MKLKFAKMHGLGNDFVVLDGIRQRIALTTAQLRFLADRHFGVGCDQMLLVEPKPRKPASISAIGSSMPMAARSSSAAMARAASSVSFMSRA
jgi:diaminopimelate epimerase